MSDESQGPGWWYATDGRWYPPEMHPDHRADPEPPPVAPPPVQPPPVAPPAVSPPPGSTPPVWSPTGAAAPPPVQTPAAGSTGGWANDPGAGLPPTLGVPRAAPPARGPSTGRIVAIVVTLVVLVLGGLALAGVLLGVGVFATQEVARSADPAACATERATLDTARSAAEATPETTDTATDYLGDDLRYFQPDGQRRPDTLADVSAQDCPALEGA